MHDIEVPAQNTAYIQWRALSAIEEKWHCFFPSTMFDKTDVLIMKIDVRLLRMTTQVMRNLIKLCVLFLNEHIWWNVSSVISKSVRRELTFLVEGILCMLHSIRGQFRGGGGLLPEYFLRKSSVFSRISLYYCPKIAIWKIRGGGGCSPQPQPPAWYTVMIMLLSS